jgi:hypothetical protein
MVFVIYETSTFVSNRTLIVLIFTQVTKNIGTCFYIADIMIIM